MSNIFESLDNQCVVETTIQESIIDQPKIEESPISTSVPSIVEIVPESDVNVIKPSTKKKCIHTLESGKRCRKNALQDNVYCNIHSEPIVKKIEDEPKIRVLTDDMAVKSLLSLHVSIYLLSEAASSMYGRPLVGLLESLGRDKEHIVNSYKDIVDYYGVENISRVVTPITGLALITTQHYIQAYSDGKKKDS